MKYTEDMMLHSPSGYCMPFEEKRGKEVELTAGYGEQKESKSGKAWFNHGVDFNISHHLLCALASGRVSGIGNDKERGIYQTIRYGEYEVTYYNLATIFANFGQAVKAGHTVAMCGDGLHLEVSFKGEELNPLEFLTMIYGNIQALKQSAQGEVEFMTFDFDVPTHYDKEKEEIEELMLRFLPLYMRDLQQGEYMVPEHTEQSLRNIFTLGTGKGYFFEAMPSISNPMGLGERCIPIATKVQNLLVADFLNYLALKQGVYLSSMNGEVKKKSTSRQ